MRRFLNSFLLTIDGFYHRSLDIGVVFACYLPYLSSRHSSHCRLGVESSDPYESGTTAPRDFLGPMSFTAALPTPSPNKKPPTTSDG